MPSIRASLYPWSPACVQVRWGILLHPKFLVLHYLRDPLVALWKRAPRTERGVELDATSMKQSTKFPPLALEPATEEEIQTVGGRPLWFRKRVQLRRVGRRDPDQDALGSGKPAQAMFQEYQKEHPVDSDASY